MSCSGSFSPSPMHAHSRPYRHRPSGWPTCCPVYPKSAGIIRASRSNQNIWAIWLLISATRAWLLDTLQASASAKEPATRATALRCLRTWTGCWSCSCRWALRFRRACSSQRGHVRPGHPEGLARARFVGGGVEYEAEHRRLVVALLMVPSLQWWDRGGCFPGAEVASRRSSPCSRTNLPDFVPCEAPFTAARSLRPWIRRSAHRWEKVARRRWMPRGVRKPPDPRRGGRLWLVGGYTPGSTCTARSLLLKLLADPVGSTQPTGGPR